MRHVLRRTALMAGIVFTAGLTSAAPADSQSFAPLPAPGQNLETVTRVDVELKGYVFGIKLLKANYNASYGDSEYAAFAKLKTSGIGAILKGFHIWAASQGRFDGTDLKPASHLQQNTNKKNRRVEMLYGADKVNVSIVPDIGSYGRPPASEAERFGADDTLAALLNIMMRGTRTSEAPCAGDVPVFDSKQHYILRLKHVGSEYIRQGGFKGDTLVCHVYYIPVSGFDTEDLPSDEEQQTPVTLNMALFEEAGLYIPVKMKYKISGFNAVIKARKILIHNTPNTVFQPYGDSFDAQEAQLIALGYVETED